MPQTIVPYCLGSTEFRYFDLLFLRIPLDIDGQMVIFHAGPWMKSMSLFCCVHKNTPSACPKVTARMLQ